MNWHVQVNIAGKWATNSYVFATAPEAGCFGERLVSQWVAPLSYRVCEIASPVTHRMDQSTRTVSAIV